MTMMTTEMETETGRKTLDEPTEAEAKRKTRRRATRYNM